MRSRRLLPLLAILLLTACIMPRPWKIRDVTTCPDNAGQPVETTLILTLRLPDCSKGILTRYRGPLRFAAASGQGKAKFYNEEMWLKALQAKIAEAGNSPVIFIHGYNNTNEQAIERAGLIARALGGRRPVIALTWPSYAKKTGYVWDEANAEWALGPASAAIASITGKYPGTILIAHSMGSRIALQAITDLEANKRLHEVSKLILAAPDVDRDALIMNWGTKGPPISVTMYVSSKDQALSLSWRTHAYPRAGDYSYWVTGRQPYPVFQYVVPGKLEVVDTTDIDRTLLGHSAFIDTREGAIDLCRVIEGAPVGRAIAATQPEANNYVRLTEHPIDDGCWRNVPTGWPQLKR